jgi:hypothetical protein
LPVALPNGGMAVFVNPVKHRSGADQFAPTLRQVCVRVCVCVCVRERERESV